MEKDERRSREWSVAGAYRLYTSTGQQIPGGLRRMHARARARSLVHDRQGRGPSISHSIRWTRLPHPRVHLSPSCSSRNSTHGVISFTRVE